MDRRDFLKKLAVGSIASAAILGALETPAKADESGITFIFAAVSYRTTNPAGEVIVLNGAGSANGDGAHGGGCYNIVNTGSPGLPKPLKEFGEWTVTELISWTPIGTYGANMAGTLLMAVQLSPAGGAPYDGTLEVVCNIPFVPFLTGKPEGFTLTTPNGTYKPGAAVGQPQAGITLFCGSGAD